MNCLDSGGVVKRYFQNIFVKSIFSTIQISHHFEFKAFIRSKFTLTEKNVNADKKAVAKNYCLYHFYNYILTVFLLFSMEQFFLELLRLFGEYLF